MSCYIHSPQKRLITILSIFHLTKISENVSLHSPECRQESQEGEAASYQWGLNYQKLLPIFHSIYFLWCWNLLYLLVFYLFDFFISSSFFKTAIQGCCPVCRALNLPTSIGKAAQIWQFESSHCCSPRGWPTHQLKSSQLDPRISLIIGSCFENIRFYSPFSINNLRKKNKPQKPTLQLHCFLTWGQVKWRLRSIIWIIWTSNIFPIETLKQLK